ncbi:hypothetical protein VTK73DRAFT_3030 [Phialemonium thermophilum]|uniref:N-acetyltransferase domain-containing protein n=1 Tax=Phialemonium thermophilum TaxID=223376 RepID=A0ABR3X1D8_9PEZI
MVLPQEDLRTWHRQVDGTSYVCSTDPGIIQPDRLNAAFASDLLWWAKAMPEASLKKMVENSLCFGLYVEQSGPSGRGPSFEMVGFARVITDHVTFAYLTDVYVLPQHQSKGLGKWLIDCLKELTGSWPELRRLMLLTTEPSTVKLYERTLGAKDVRESSPKIVVMEKIGPTGKSS